MTARSIIRHERDLVNKYITFIYNPLTTQFQSCCTYYVLACKIPSYGINVFFVKTTEPKFCDVLLSNDVGAGYKSLASNISKFYVLGYMPLPLNIKVLDEGNGTEDYLYDA